MKSRGKRKKEDKEEETKEEGEGDREGERGMGNGGGAPPPENPACLSSAESHSWEAALQVELPFPASIH